MTKKVQRSAKWPNVFGGLGYISVLLQWLWSLAIFLPLLLDNENFRNLFIPHERPTQPEQIITVDSNSLALTAIAILVTIIVLAVTLVILAKLPLAIVRTGKKAVDATVDATLPVVAHHQKLSQKKKQALSTKLRRSIKLTLCTLPVLPLGAVPFSTIELEPAIVIIVGCFLAIGSLIWFTIQYLLAHILRVPADKLI